MSTVNVAFVTIASAIVKEPQILLVRPTAVAFWPTRTSWTRYPAMDPVPTFQVPSSDDDVEADPFDVLEVVEPDDLGSSSLAGAGPSMKWM